MISTTPSFELLADALHRCLLLSEQIGMIGVAVDAKHERDREAVTKPGSGGAV